MAELPFQIDVPDSKIADLRAKLDAAVLPDQLEDAGWKYGAPLTDIKRLVARWKDIYDWKKHEQQINEELPQFTRDIEVQGFGPLNIHYVHKKSQAAGAIPLLFVHGWPGSFLEVGKILPLLTAVSPEHPSFHVVAFSLPGFSFSEAPTKPGFAATQYAEVGNKLMLELGYEEYVTQGGDWGYMVTHKIAIDYGGRHSKAWHTNYPKANPPRLLRSPIYYMSHLLTPYSAVEKAGLARTLKLRSEGIGYYVEQKTVPQTLGYSLADSPVGLLAWIYEKLVMWTDDYSWTDDEVLTWISVYWFSRAGPVASLRIYHEVGPSPAISDPIPNIPMGCSFFPRELISVPRNWVRASGNVVFMSEHSSGGHFAAHEKPEALVQDIRAMFQLGGPAFGVVRGKTGYATP